MKMTIDLPHALIKQVKMCALYKGQVLNEAVAELLLLGLRQDPDVTAESAVPQITKDNRTGLPVIRCQRPASQAQELTPDRVAEILLEGELSSHRTACQ